MLIFKNQYNQLRSGWKIAISFLILFLTIFILSIIIGVFGGIFSISRNNPIYSLLNMGVSTISFILVSLISWKLVQKEPFRNMGLTSIKRDGFDLLFGLFLGAMSITIVFFILIATNNATLVTSFLKPNFSYEILLGIVIFILVGFGEEMFFRGYLMSVLKQTNNSFVIILVSSLIFSLMHASNLNANPLGLFNIFLVGIVFAYMFIRSSSIWMPIGYHITWNYFQGYVFGFQVSGNPTNGLYETTVAQNNLINGGAFGPEGGAAVTFILIVNLAILYLYYRRNKTIKYV